MAIKDFLLQKLKYLTKDAQPVFDRLSDTLQQGAENAAPGKSITVPVDGDWFRISFDAIEEKDDRAVITAHRTFDGMVAGRYNPCLREFRVEFHGTRAAYLFGEYHERHSLGAGHIFHGQSALMQTILKTRICGFMSQVSGRIMRYDV